MKPLLSLCLAAAVGFSSFSVAAPSLRNALTKRQTIDNAPDILEIVDQLYTDIGQYTTVIGNTAAGLTPASTAADGAAAADTFRSAIASIDTRVVDSTTLITAFGADTDDKKRSLPTTKSLLRRQEDGDGDPTGSDPEDPDDPDDGDPTGSDSDDPDNEDGDPTGSDDGNGPDDAKRLRRAIKALKKRQDDGDGDPTGDDPEDPDDPDDPDGGDATGPDDARRSVRSLRSLLKRQDDGDPTGSDDGDGDDDGDPTGSDDGDGSDNAKRSVKLAQLLGKRQDDDGGDDDGPPPPPATTDPTGLAAELAAIIEGTGGALDQISAKLGLATTQSYLGTLVPDMSALVASIVPVVDNLDAILAGMVEGIPGGISPALGGIVV